MSRCSVGDVTLRSFDGLEDNPDTDAGDGVCFLRPGAGGGLMDDALQACSSASVFGVSEIVGAIGVEPVAGVDACVVQLRKGLPAAKYAAYSDSLRDAAFLRTPTVASVAGNASRARAEAAALKKCNDELDFTTTSLDDAADALRKVRGAADDSEADIAVYQKVLDGAPGAQKGARESAAAECPKVDCKVGEWTICSKICGTGVQSRPILVHDANGGQSCGSYLLKRACNEQACPPEPCQVTAWSECSAKCNGGTRTRKVTAQDRYGGLPTCDSLPLTEECGKEKCPPENCVMSDWTQCSKTCGGGKQTRTIVKNEKYGGTPCSSMPTTQQCGMDTCDVDCVVGGWNVTPCNRGCGGGWITRTPVINVYSKGNGRACPSTTNEQCNTQPCPVDCVPGPWSNGGQWSGCSASCGGGWQYITRGIQQQAQYGGSCNVTTQLQNQCNTQSCPSPPALPGGSYRWSCQSCGFDGYTLRCNCRSIDGNLKGAQAAGCGNYSNQNGDLRCE